MKAMFVKFKIILLMLLVPIASIFEMTRESYLNKVIRNYQELIEVLKL